MQDPFRYGCTSEKQLRRLWPDPMQAPEVPSETVLRQYLADEKSVDEKLQEQFEALPNCRRAIANLQADLLLQEVMPDTDDDVPTPDFASLPKPNLEQISKPSVARSQFSVQCGAMCSTNSIIPFWQGGLIEREIFSSEVVLILAEGEPFHNKRTWRIAPCEPAITCLEDLGTEADLKFTSPESLEYIARLDLATDVMERQLDEVLCIVDISQNILAEKASQTWEHGKRLEIARDDGHLELQWRQTIAKATLLDAEIQAEKEKLEQQGNLIFFLLASQASGMAMAADTPEAETSSVIGQIKGSPLQLIAQFLPESDQNQVCFRVVDTDWKRSTELDGFQIDNPFESKDFIPIQDGIAYFPFPFEKLKEGFPFLLLDPEGNEIKVEWTQENEN